MAIAQHLTLEDFLQLPKTKPASEYVAEEIIVKPMLQGEHNGLQCKIYNEINRINVIYNEIAVVVVWR